MKKLIALIVCMALVLSIGMTAFAAEQVLKVYRTNEPATLDRVAPTIDEAGKYILFDASEPLFRINEGATVPAGCESYTYDEAAMTYTFVIRDNWWQDGVQVTAQDYLYSFQRMVNPNTAYGYVSDLYCIENAEAINAGQMDVAELGVTAPDAKTLVIKLNESTPAFLEVVPMYPQRQDFVEACGDAYGSDADKFLSCGPFVLTQWEHNVQAVLVKNEKYWDAANVKLDTVTVMFNSDASTLFNSMQNGGLDYMETSNQDYINDFESNAAFNVVSRTTPTLTFVLFNCEDPVMSNVKVRQAFSLAIDREMYTEMLYYGMHQPAFGLCSPAIGINGVALRDVVPEALAEMAETVDPRELLIEGLKELGLDPNPAKLKVEFSMGGTSAGSNNQMAMYQAMWEETLGVTVVPDQTEWASFWTDCKQGAFQMGTLAWSGEVDISFLFNLFLSDSRQMPCFYYTKEYDEIVTKANKSTDPAERLQLYGEAEKLIMVDYCSIAPVVYQNQKAVLRSNVKGWDFNVFSTMGHKNVYIED